MCTPIHLVLESYPRAMFWRDGCNTSCAACLLGRQRVGGSEHSPFGWIEPEIARYSVSLVNINDFCSGPRRARPDTVLTEGVQEHILERLLPPRFMQGAAPLPGAKGECCICNFVICTGVPQLIRNRLFPGPFGGPETRGLEWS